MKCEWKTFPTFALLLLSGPFIGTIVGNYYIWNYQYWWIPFSDVIYEDMKSLNVTCNGMDSCEVPRTNEAWNYNCNCDETCSFLGTCCVDSKYRQKYKQKYLKNVECRQLNNNRQFYYPLINNCNPYLQYDNTTKELCEGRGEYLNDPFLDILVTDPATGITYKNYYCFVCNENSGEERLIPWDVVLGGDLEKVNKSEELPNLQNFERDSWRWVLDDDNVTEVSLFHALPEVLEDCLPYCYAFNIVSECALNWTDENVRTMCHEYMALTRFRSEDLHKHRYYRNPHCAICNYENMDDMVCMIEGEYKTSAPGGLIPTGDYFVRLFSLHDKASYQCSGRMVYDHFAKKCRRLYTDKRRRQDGGLSG
ncbi:uncharacterized protein [Parasteatoda tepidariorum]|uniref:uncharacterized protein n=1 Tax=Parasteatoda tepidariorum TaxID=114398 RepID=UPI001C72304E|nr:uncharacterized protein LOC107446899 [Parasteatoda tepidariorum]XP_042900162.1 uncharacterized protein LOC107446899 [Parasteatoda tepidariorum]XP_042900163.1 uncharacterized protein LOC107446899 [Parasteatoda tepidariorum]